MLSFVASGCVTIRSLFTALHVSCGSHMFLHISEWLLVRWCFSPFSSSGSTHVILSAQRSQHSHILYFFHEGKMDVKKNVSSYRFCLCMNTKDIFL